MSVALVQETLKIPDKSVDKTTAMQALDYSFDLGGTLVRSKDACIHTHTLPLKLYTCQFTNKIEANKKEEYNKTFFI